MGLLDQIEVLKAADGKPALLALATVDLAYGDLPEPQRMALKDALEAAAVPHWIDESVLGTLVGASVDDSKQLLARLRALRVLEPFPARGPGAVNVHQASRNALRDRLIKEHHEKFVALSAKAREAMQPKSGIAHRIEALYHNFAVNQEIAASEWEILEREIAHPLHRSAIGAALEELRKEGWLDGAGKAAALLAGGLIKMELGESTQLEETAREVIALASAGGRQILLGFGQCMLGEALSEKGKLQDASKAFQIYLDIFERQSKSDPKWRRELAVAYTRVADVQEKEGKLVEALRSLQTCLQMMRELVKADPRDWTLHRELAETYNRIAVILQDANESKVALENYRWALEVYEGLTTIDSTDIDWQQGVGRGHLNIGSVLQEQGQLDEALEAFNKSLELYKKLAQMDSGAKLQRDIAAIHAWIGGTYYKQGKYPESLEAHRENLRISERLIDEYPQNIGFRGNLALAQWNVSASLEQMGQKEEALAGYRRVETELARVVKEAPTVARWRKLHDEIRGLIANSGGSKPN